MEAPSARHEAFKNIQRVLILRNGAQQLFTSHSADWLACLPVTQALHTQYTEPDVMYSRQCVWQSVVKDMDLNLLWDNSANHYTTMLLPTFQTLQPPILQMIKKKNRKRDLSYFCWTDNSFLSGFTRHSRRVKQAYLSSKHYFIWKWLHQQIQKNQAAAEKLQFTKKESAAFASSFSTWMCWLWLYSSNLITVSCWQMCCLPIWFCQIRASLCSGLVDAGNMSLYYF